jgi:hypothetical protein
MGYNRGGQRRTARLRRRKKLENRLAARTATREKGGEKVKDAMK